MKKYVSLWMDLFLPNIKTYTHRTSESNAISIMSDGFLCTKQLRYTTDYVSDEISFRYFTGHRKSYGVAIVIIQFSTKLIERSNWLEILTDEVKLKVLEAKVNENGGESCFDFLVPPRFIRGYMIGKKIVENPEFNPF